MKNALITTLLLASAAFVMADEKHSHAHAKSTTEVHDHQHEKAPNGGRIIHSVDPHAEFLFTAERTVEIRFLKDGAVIAPSGQSVTLIGGDRAKPTRLSFAVDGDKLVSSGPLPEGDNLPIILQIKTSADAKAVMERFTLNLAKCPECKLLEYACVCEHGEGGHDHSHDGHKH